MEAYQAKLEKRYGPTVRIRLLGENYVLINDAALTQEVMNTQVKTFSVSVLRGHEEYVWRTLNVCFHYTGEISALRDRRALP
jgi:hypothetical protein